MNRDGGVLEVRDLVREVRVDGVRRVIVDNISFAFNSGRIYSILGPSGAGKSSLLRLLNRLDEPTSGMVLVNGQDYRTLVPCELRRRIGYLFQVPYLFPETVADNLRAADDKLDESAIEGLLTQVSLSSMPLNRKVASLSIGERQRVALARLLATDPDIVLLDEPTAALDPSHAANIEKTIHRLAGENGLTVVMVSHNPEQAARMGGEGLLIVGGQLVEHGPVAELVNSPKSELGRRYKDRDLI